MTLQIILMLFGAGIVGGVLSSLVGGASLITFPVFLAAGLPPLIATASNQAAVLPSNCVAALSDRTLWPPLDRAFAILVAASVAGTAAGSGLLLVTPERVFEILVPLLLLLATVLFAISPRVVGWLRARARASGKPQPAMGATSIGLLLPVSVYSGYFGAGVGILLLAVFSIATEGNYRAANIIKNIVSSITTAAAVLCLAIGGAIDWPPTLVMMAGSLFGGLLGGRLARIAPPSLMRVVVVAVGMLLTVTYAWRYWF